MAVMVVVAYDVKDDNRRARLAALLQQHGDRIQRSVFLLTITAECYTEVEQQMRGIVKLSADSVYVLRQCGSCWDDRTCIGQAHPPEPILYWSAL